MATGDNIRRHRKAKGFAAAGATLGSAFAAKGAASTFTFEKFG